MSVFLFFSSLLIVHNNDDDDNGVKNADTRMYSRDDTVAAVLAFYRQILKQTYLDESVLIVPPPSGWETVDEEGLRAIGKNDTVVDLVRHLPYLHDPGADGLIVDYDTEPFNYTVKSQHYINDLHPIPSHCVYLTHGMGREGYDFILDTERGTTTAFSIMEYELSTSYPDYENLPESEQWRAHRTLPTVDFFAARALRYAKLVWILTPDPKRSTGRIYSRANNRPQEEELCHQELTKWTPDFTKVEAESNITDRAGKILDLKHVANVYNAHLRHGWSGAHFDKQACRAELLELHKQFDMEKGRLLDLADPDAGLFD